MTATGPDEHAEFDRIMTRARQEWDVEQEAARLDRDTAITAAHTVYRDRRQRMTERFTAARERALRTLPKCDPEPREAPNA